MGDAAAAAVEASEVEAWRLRCLLEAGYERHRAEQLAQADVDLHRAVRLLEEGCPAKLAVQILL